MIIEFFGGEVNCEVFIIKFRYLGIFFFFEGVIIEVFMLLIFVFVWIEKEVGWFIFKLFFVRFDILRFWK